MSTNGIENAAIALEASRRTGLLLSRACAMLEMESGGRNVFGADAGQPNALPDGWRDGAVTYLRFQYFWRRVKKGLVSNGVGPTQLTSAFLIEAANKAGGAWKVLPNMITGFAYLDQLIKAKGELHGFGAYNGSLQYGLEAQALRNKWHDLFTVGRFE